MKADLNTMTERRDIAREASEFASRMITLVYSSGFG